MDAWKDELETAVKKGDESRTQSQIRKRPHQDPTYGSSPEKMPKDDESTRVLDHVPLSLSNVSEDSRINGASESKELDMKLVASMSDDSELLKYIQQISTHYANHIDSK